jgi:hypothetical protein
LFDEKGAADCLGIRRLLDAEIIGEPAPETFGPVPCERFEIVADRMIGALSRSQIDGLVRYVFAGFWEFLKNRESSQGFVDSHSAHVADWLPRAGKSRLSAHATMIRGARR